MSVPAEIIIERDKDDGQSENGIIVPMDRINPDTLRSMAEEFVTREWSELADARYTLESKIEQVLRQLRTGKARIVFDLTTETCNIVPADSLPRV